MMDWFPWIFFGLSVLGACSIIVWNLIENAPLIEEYPVDDAKRIVAGSRRDWEQLEARADELVKIHGFLPGTYEADEMASVILSREDYLETLTRIQKFRRVNAKYQQEAAKADRGVA